MTREILGHLRLDHVAHVKRNRNFLEAEKPPLYHALVPGHYQFLQRLDGGPGAEPLILREDVR